MTQAYHQRSPQTREHDRQRNKARYQRRFALGIKVPSGPHKNIHVHRRTMMLKRSYGLSLAEYDELFAAQNGVCAICACPETYKAAKSPHPKALSVDHDHTTATIRGLLCHRCNVGLGLFNDDILRLRAAIAYLLPTTNK